MSITFFKAYTKLCRGLCFSSLFMNNLLVRHAFFRRLQQILDRGVSWNWGFQHLLDLACYVISPANSTVVYRQVMFKITWMSHNNMSHDNVLHFCKLKWNFMVMNSIPYHQDLSPAQMTTHWQRSLTTQVNSTMCTGFIHSDKLPFTMNIYGSFVLPFNLLQCRLLQTTMWYMW